ncbi:hypothetical protein LTR86_003075 [Recurvomyces mirabilis]|nr:hypothetical protein LTR86_003075 [Recurvomyces mirabilis]
MTSASNLHALLLLSDSALPLGSFAFSSGLESYLAHSKLTTSNNKTSPPNNKLHDFEQFLQHSLSNLSSTALPYVLAAYHSPGYEVLEGLDNDFDASTPCTVARRASLTQGRALLTVWERALRTTTSTSTSDRQAEEASRTLTAFATALKTSKPDPLGLQLNGHFPPLFGLVCRALCLGEEETNYLFLLSHAKAVLSAAVRAGVMGPYQSQGVLASAKLQGWIRRCCEQRVGNVCGGNGEGVVGVEDAAVMVPMMDLWMGRHELLYSRIFNS